MSCHHFTASGFNLWCEPCHIAEAHRLCVELGREAKELRSAGRHMRQVVHQAHHEGPADECRKGACGAWAKVDA